MAHHEALTLEEAPLAPEDFFERMQLIAPLWQGPIFGRLDRLDRHLGEIFPSHCRPIRSQRAPHSRPSAIPL